MSLFCDSLPPSLAFWSAGWGFCCAFFFQLIFITGTHKTAQASLPPFIITLHRNSGVPQSCRKPSPMANTQLHKTFTLLMQIPHCTSDLGRPARETCHSSGLMQGTQSSWELLEMPFSSLKHSLPLLGCGPCMTSPHLQHWLNWHFKQKAGSPRRLK